MAMEANLNKGLYKWTLFTLKIIPALIALFCFINTLLSLFSIEVPMLSYIAGLSFLPMVFLFLTSFAFKFCPCHRMFLYYIVVNNCVCIYDYYIGIPVEITGMISIVIILYCIFLFLTVYLYVTHHKKPSNEGSK